MLLVGVGNTKKTPQKQKQTPKTPHKHSHQNGTKGIISSIKWMPLRLPSHTTESASVSTVVHINSFLSPYLQPNWVRIKLDNGVKTCSNTFGLLVDCCSTQFTDPIELNHPCNLQKAAIATISRGISKVCESQSLNSPVSQPSYSSHYSPIQDATLKMHLLINIYLNVIKFKHWNWDLANKIIYFLQQQWNACHALDVFPLQPTKTEFTWVLVAHNFLVHFTSC